MQDPDPPKTQPIELLRRLNEIAFRRLRAFTKRIERIQEYQRLSPEKTTEVKSAPPPRN